MAEKKVLIVEDDIKIANLIGDYLTTSGFKISILVRGDGVVDEVRNNPPDLIILDVMLPGKDGISICSEIRSFSKVPILFCSARIDDIDRILGLEIGADDYISKPFSPREVVARVKAVLRRTAPYIENESELVAGPIVIRPESHRATIFGKQLDLTPNEFELLKILAAHPGKTFTRNHLASNLKGYDQESNLRIIDSHMKNLRKKIDNCSPDINIIKTIYGVGYSIDVSPDAFERKETDTASWDSQSSA